MEHLILAINYIPLTTGVPGISNVDSSNLTTYLQTLFEIGISIAAAAAVVMIIVGGIQYMSTDAAGGKSEGKEKITAALWGLLLALIAWLILNTINPQLVSTNLDIAKYSTDAQAGSPGDPGSPGTSGEPGGSEYILPGDPRYPYKPGDSNYGQPAPVPNPYNYAGPPNPNAVSGPQAQAILQAAQNAANGTCPITGTGNLGCAAAVNEIISRATGHPINDSASTIQMQQSLSNNPNFAYVGSSFADARPGDIVVSPTQGDVHGHTGIVATAGGGSIISNSSASGSVKANYNASSWNNYYVTGKGLQVYIYRPIH